MARPNGTAMGGDRGSWTRRSPPTDGAAALAALIICGRHITSEEIYSIGTTADGQIFEDEATTTLGPGYAIWILATGALLAAAGAGLLASRRHRT